MDSGGECGVNVANGGVGVPASGVVLSGARYLRTNCGANLFSDVVEISNIPAPMRVSQATQDSFQRKIVR